VHTQLKALLKAWIRQMQSAAIFQRMMTLYGVVRDTRESFSFCRLHFRVCVSSHPTLFFLFSCRACVDWLQWLCLDFCHDLHKYAGRNPPPSRVPTR
jgi:hypothetical protein